MGVLTRLLLSGRKLPKQALLVHLKTPNSDNLLNNEETLTDEELLDIGYSLPVSVYAAVGTGAWFSDATTPITRLMSDILLTLPPTPITSAQA